MSNLSIRHPLEGTPYLVAPLEAHTFTVDPRDDYRCSLCKRPRAMHASPGDYIAKVMPNALFDHVPCQFQELRAQSLI